MDNLWILTEERPKASVICQIIELYERDFGSIIKTIDKPNVKIRADFQNGFFQFSYTVEGISVQDIDKIIIKTVSGNSSFFDFLVFKQENAPSEDSSQIPLMAIEETKTNDDESRNTAVYQRASKFVFIDAFYQNVKLYMLYNEELEAREEKRPSDTSIFGTNMLLTLDVDIIGKNTSEWFSKFNSIEEIIRFKAGMRQPPSGNIPINITRFDNHIEVSGRLAKPAHKGNIGHDPNIGALSLISKCLRILGWKKRIIITRHGVTQDYVNRTHGKNKFLYICNLLDIELEGIVMPKTVSLPENYWHYEMNSEKMASMLLHIVGEYHGLRGIYQNHAGCERGYFKTKTNKRITLPKKDQNGVNLYIPDLVLHEPVSKYIILVEGKKLSTLQAGIKEIEDYDSIEHEFIKPYYDDCQIYRCISIFGGNLIFLPHPKVILYLSETGRVIINPTAPKCILDIFKKEGISI